MAPFLANLDTEIGSYCKTYFSVFSLMTDDMKLKLRVK